MLAANMSVGRDTPPLTELQLLHNEKFFLNLTQVLNISADNLTSLLHGLEPQDLLEQPQPTQATLPPMGLLATLSVCYALIFVAGVLGNLITCIVISRNNFMHTATNFYLFNLAISDLILLCSGRCKGESKIEESHKLLSLRRHATGSVQPLAAGQLSLLRWHLHPGERALRDRSQRDCADYHVVHCGTLHRHLSSLQVSGCRAAEQLIDVSPSFPPSPLLHAQAAHNVEAVACHQVHLCHLDCRPAARSAAGDSVLRCQPGRRFIMYGKYVTACTRTPTHAYTHKDTHTQSHAKHFDPLAKRELRMNSK